MAPPVDGEFPIKLWKSIPCSGIPEQKAAYIPPWSLLVTKKLYYVALRGAVSY